MYKVGTCIFCTNKREASYRRANANFVLLVNTFKNKGPYSVELYLMQMFDHFKTR